MYSLCELQVSLDHIAQWVSAYIVTDPLRTYLIQTERKNVRSLSTLSDMIGQTL